MSEQMLQHHSNLSYLGNANVKRDGVQQNWTQEEINEYAKCLKDPVYFARNYIKVISLDHGLVPFDLYPYQENMFKHFNDNRFSIVLACRQSGKCQSINSTISIKHKGTNEERTVSFGEFYEILSSDLESDNRRIKSKRKVETSALEEAWRRDNSTPRYNLRTEEIEASCAENVCAQSRARKVHGSYGNWYHMSDMWNLYQKQIGSTHSKSTFSRPQSVSRRTLVGFLEKCIFKIIFWLKQCLVQPWWKVQPVFKRFSELLERSNKESCRKSFLHNTIRLLSGSWYVGNESQNSAFGKTNNIFFTKMLRKVWRRWFTHIRRSSESVAEHIKLETTGRKRSNTNGEINWQDESAFQFRSESEKYTRNSLYCQVHDDGNFKNILESWYNFQNRREQILDTWHSQEWNIVGNHLSAPYHILSSIQDGTANIERKSLDKNNHRGFSGFNNGGIHGGTKLSDTVERKFIETLNASDYLIWTDTGWEQLQTLNKTVQYEKYIVKFDDGTQTKVADTHIFFDSDLNEVFAKDSCGSILYGEFANKTVTEVIPTGIFEHMYDVSIDSENHRYYSDGVLSHNSISSVVYLLWYAIFNPEKTIAILANKGATAKEMLARVTLALENLPFFLQPGCKALNKTSIEFSNNSRIIAASTSSSSIRGMSCVPDYIRVCVLLENGDIYYTSLENANYINKNESKFIEEKHDMGHSKKYNFVYKTTNIVNDKEYIGYHGTDNLDDGYLGSGKLLKRAIEKYGPESFTREILAFFDNPTEALEYEKKIVNEEYVKREDTYNLIIGGDACILYGENNGFYGKTHSDETKSKIREKHLGKSIHTEESKRKISEKSKQRWKDPEYRERILSSLANRIVTDETRKKLRDAHLGKTVSEETKQKISNARLNFFSNMSEEEYTEWYNSTHGPDQRKKRSESLTGLTKSKEWVDKINKNPEKIKKTAEAHRGMKRSEESKKKMSIAKRGKKPHNLGKVYIHNPTTKEKRMIDKNEPIPEGFKRGHLKLNENTK